MIYSSRFVKPLQAIFWCVMLSGCITYHPVSPNYANSEDTYILNLLYVKQEKKGCCGLNCLAMVVSYWRDDITSVNSLYQLTCPQNGFSGEELRDIANLNGFHAYIFKGDLSNLYLCLNATRPLIVMLGKQKTLGLLSSFLRFGNNVAQHYAIVIGYAKSAKKIILMDPLNGLVSISENDFVDAWNKTHRFSMLIVPK